MMLNDQTAPLTIPFYKESAKQWALFSPLIFLIPIGSGIIFLSQENLYVSFNSSLTTNFSFLFSFFVTRAILNFIWEKGDKNIQSLLKCVVIFLMSLLLLWITPRLVSFPLFDSACLVYVMIGVIRSFLYVALSTFFISFFYSIFIAFSKGPAVRLDPKGIWIKHFDFIPWDTIEEISLKRKWNGYIKGIGITLKNRSTVFNQSSLVGKCIVLWNTFINTPPIVLMHIAPHYEEVIISYAHQFMKNNQN